MPDPDPARRLKVEGHTRLAVDSAWQLARSPAGAHPDPAGIEELDWIDAEVPGTVAGALAHLEQGGLPVPAMADLDAEDWWFRVSFEAPQHGEDEDVLLRLDGIATLSESYLNGALIHSGESMFAHAAAEVTALLRPHNDLAICCRALAPLLQSPRRPRARWRTRLADGGLRFHRTMLLGRAPGFAPEPAVIGPWREVHLERRSRLLVERLELRPRVQDGEGVLAVRLQTRSLRKAAIVGAEVELTGPTGRHVLALALTGDVGDDGAVALAGELRVAEPALWWPHTHGDPTLYRVRLRIEDADGQAAIDAGSTGFRRLAFGAGDVAEEGISLSVNGASVFARGAVWTPPDPIGMAPTAADLRRSIETARAAGMNMLRIPGTASYESAVFHDLCDELGMMVWQDLMFANFDYPIADEGFRATVEAELQDVIADLGGRPSLTVVCGNSEVEQQVAMLGLDPALGRGELFGELIPSALAAAGLDASYVPSAPCGGDLPFRPGRGVANYYGVGGYRRPLEDARRAGVRFAAECLAFSNVPGEEAIERMMPGAPGDLVVHHPVWKAGVPRDVGSGWDFEDVRDHYLQLLFGVDPAELRRTDHDRYLELSRAVTGEVMAEVFGEWRREASSCGGALVLWLRDLIPGAGWGLLDDHGRPKVAYHHLRRALAPVAVWTIDEGLGGVGVYVANDRPEPLSALLRVTLYAGLERRVEDATVAVELAPHSQQNWDVEGVIGRFADAAWAYRFGPPAHDAIVVTLHARAGEGEGEGEVLSQAFRFPAGRPLQLEDAGTLGLSARVLDLNEDSVTLVVGATRLAYGVRLHAAGFDAEDDSFTLEPGHERIVRLTARADGGEWRGGTVTALNLRGRAAIAPKS